MDAVKNYYNAELQESEQKLKDTETQLKQRQISEASAREKIWDQINGILKKFFDKPKDPDVIAGTRGALEQAHKTKHKFQDLFNNWFVPPFMKEYIHKNQSMRSHGDTETRDIHNHIERLLEDHSKYGMKPPYTPQNKPRHGNQRNRK